MFNFKLDFHVEAHEIESSAYHLLFSILKKMQVLKTQGLEFLRMSAQTVKHRLPQWAKPAALSSSIFQPRTSCGNSTHTKSG